ncbi:restriction endonuclease subunit S [Xanthomonas campestris pv. plantaginis]|nr:restriction endonuclease subunit S [Xanthomonas campestris pv. plantaginis]
MANDLVPKLRFPGFGDAWQSENLGRICNMQAGKFMPAANIREVEREDLYPCFGGNGLRGYTATYTNDGALPLIGRQGALCGNVTFATGKFHATEHAIVANPKPGICVEWLYYALDFLKLNRFATGQAQPGLSVEVLNQVDCSRPLDEEEQRQIAGCLSSLDDCIDTEIRKLDALKTHKQGLMDQLFPTEGQRLPSLRFPGFAGRWDEVALSSQVELISGQHLAPDQYSIDGEIPYFTGPSDYANSLTSVSKWTESSRNMGRKGDTLITVKGSGVGELLHLKLEEVAMGRQLMAVRPIAADGDFVFQFLLTQRQRLVSLAAGNLIPGLSRGDILGLPVLVPKREEQIKIGEFLASLDALIDSLSLKATMLKQHKRGLMHGLFPAIEAHAS